MAGMIARVEQQARETREDLEVYDLAKPDLSPTLITGKGQTV